MNEFLIDGVALYYPDISDVESFRYCIQSHRQNYTIEGFQDLASIIVEIQSGFDTCLVIDGNVYRKYVEKEVGVDDSRLYVVDACEEVKSIDTALDICRFFAENNVNKASKVYVVGGGVLQDLGGTASYLYKRGVPWIYVPTTLLGMSDSCVGGKTAVNFGMYKNLLGLFSAPNKIILCSDFLASLTPSQLACG